MDIGKWNTVQENPWKYKVFHHFQSHLVLHFASDSKGILQRPICPKLASRPIFGGRCKYKKMSLCSYSLCEVIGSPNLSGTTARWFLRRIKCCYYSISAPFFQEEITWNSAYFFGLNRYVKTKKQGQNLLRLCKRICPCGCYKVLASDFKSAAISGFCRSFRSNSLSSVELSCAAVCTGSGVACLPE